jgi:hypothetical protein
VAAPTLRPAHAFANSPLYRRFHRGLERAPLTELPSLSKVTLMNASAGTGSRRRPIAGGGGPRVHQKDDRGLTVLLAAQAADVDPTQIQREVTASLIAAGAASAVQVRVVDAIPAGAPGKRHGGVAVDGVEAVGLRTGEVSDPTVPGQRLRRVSAAQ